MGACLDHEESVDGPLLTQGPKVEKLTAAVNPSEPSVTLRWDPPADWDVAEIRGYDIRFKTLCALEYSECHVGAGQTSYTLRVGSGLQPLSSSQFEVRAVQNTGVIGEWSSDSRLVDWHCRLPTCGQNRVRKYDGQIYDFCGRACARFYCSRHCMYPVCLRLKEIGDWYCSQHKEEALHSGGAFVLELDPQSDNFKSFHKRFKKAWPQSKGNAPKVSFIYKIINPQVTKHFGEYLHGLPVSYRKPAQLYHGTRLHCNIAEFPELCQNPNCGVCSMSRGKAQPLQLEEGGGGGSGAGLCFSANPFRSHLFASSTTGPHKAILMCKVAMGSKSKMDATGEGVDSTSPSPDMGGRQTGDIVVRNIDAVCPLCIIIYTYTYNND